MIGSDQTTESKRCWDYSPTEIEVTFSYSWSTHVREVHWIAVIPSETDAAPEPSAYELRRRQLRHWNRLAILARSKERQKPVPPEQPSLRRFKHRVCSLDSAWRTTITMSAS